MWLLWTLFIGFIIGVIAKFITPGRDKGGFILTSLLGIGGALMAGYLGQAFGCYLPGETAGFFSSIIGAVILLSVVRALTEKR